MTEKPILFSGAMVRAIREGRKTQTRRVLKLPTKNIYVHPKMGGWAATTIGGNDGSFHIIKGEKVSTKETACIWHQTSGDCIATPFQLGDRLWVREAWRAELSWQSLKPSDIPQGAAIFYEADGSKTDNGMGAKFPGKLRPSMFMPRWASRITLEVTAVKVERLQDISADDAVGEGAYFERWTTGEYPFFDVGVEADNKALIKQFERIWETVNGPGSWDENPWVAAYTFRRVTE